MRDTDLPYLIDAILIRHDDTKIGGPVSKPHDLLITIDGEKRGQKCGKSK